MIAPSEWPRSQTQSCSVRRRSSAIQTVASSAYSESHVVWVTLACADAAFVEAQGRDAFSGEILGQHQVAGRKKPQWIVAIAVRRARAGQDQRSGTGWGLWGFNRSGQLPRRALNRHVDRGCDGLGGNREKEEGDDQMLHGNNA
ncbi:hypothetical protein [Nioella sp.]|uniref:hypothetical protein n=1 Tax=Nioella sp. TaxID=1912091 RepID=UPI003A866B60